MADLEHLEQRLVRLEQAVARLESRLGNVTPTIAAPRPTPATSAATNNDHRPKKAKYIGARWAVGLGGFLMLYVAPLIGAYALFGLVFLLAAIVWPFRQTTVASEAPTSVNAAPLPKPHHRSAFEQDLAKHWFSWLGIISLVVGVGLFLQYSLRSLGPIGNIITAYAVAGMLFGLWSWFRTRYRGFGFILQAGAWAIVYLATYAFQNVAGGPVSSPFVAGVLLLVVVACILLAALEQRSRTLTAGAFLLGFLTAATNTVDLFTLGALILLAAGLAVTTTIQRWPMLLLWGNLAVYVVHFLWMVDSQTTIASQTGLAAGFLIGEALIFGLAHWLLKIGSKNDQLTTSAGTIANLSGFFVLFQYTANSSEITNVWVATMFLAIVCALLAIATMLVRNRSWLRSIYIVFAIAFLAIATAQRFDDEARILGWLIEGAALVVAGGFARSLITRLSGTVLSVGAFFSVLAILGVDRAFGSTAIPTRLILGPAAVLLYGLVAQTLRYVRSHLRPGETLASTVWADAAIIVMLVTTFLQWPVAWGVVVTGIVATVMIGIGIAWRSANGRWGGTVLFVVAVLAWLAVVAPSTALAGTLNIHARLVSGLMITLLVYVVAWWTRLRVALLPSTEKSASEGLAWLGLIALNAVVAVESPLRLLSVYWGLIGIGLYLYGFSLKSVAARRQGLAIIGLTIVKVYLYDVRLLERGYQILSFILLGGILLGIGFLYNRWRQNQSPKTPTT